MRIFPVFVSLLLSPAVLVAGHSEKGGLSSDVMERIEASREKVGNFQYKILGENLLELTTLSIYTSYLNGSDTRYQGDARWEADRAQILANSDSDLLCKLFLGPDAKASSVDVKKQ